MSKDERFEKYSKARSLLIHFQLRTRRGLKKRRAKQKSRRHGSYRRARQKRSSKGQRRNSRKKVKKQNKNKQQSSAKAKDKSKQKQTTKLSKRQSETKGKIKKAKDTRLTRLKEYTFQSDKLPAANQEKQHDRGSARIKHNSQRKAPLSFRPAFACHLPLRKRHIFNTVAPLLFIG